MRTTLTVDPDVAQLLNAAMLQSGKSFKTTVNQALRKGLSDIVIEAAEPPFQVKPKVMGIRPGLDPARLQELDDELEIDAFLELTQRLERQPPPSAS